MYGASHMYIPHSDAWNCALFGMTQVDDALVLAMIVGIVPFIVTYLSWAGVSLRLCPAPAWQIFKPSSVSSNIPATSLISNPSSISSCICLSDSSGGLHSWRGLDMTSMAWMAAFAFSVAKNNNLHNDELGKPWSLAACFLACVRRMFACLLAQFLSKAASALFFWRSVR